MTLDDKNEDIETYPEPVVEPELPESIKAGVAITLVIILGLFLLTVVVGPLLAENYRVESLLVVGVVPVVVGAVLLLLGVRLPDWWRK